MQEALRDDIKMRRVIKWEDLLNIIQTLLGTKLEIAQLEPLQRRWIAHGNRSTQALRHMDLCAETCHRQTMYGADIFDKMDLNGIW